MIQNVTTPAVQPLNLIQSQSVSTSQSPSESLSEFGSYLKDAIDSVASQEQNVQTLNNQFMAGKVNIDQVMVGSEQALLSLQLTTQVRNKVIEAYQEIMRTQM
ncbi:flagellar hook-basal body complex protein FliE [Paenibacillus pinistramenti]|uniref:flagellar hook-basal body complex protein FliE n=1 Tax=Paenibacillus pinistramenti TaxID=1768003 RepID=UPI0011099160|nr:flagellar hook-basal body complex protein FliE [Paenibacillus pinistramenti]